MADDARQRRVGAAVVRGGPVVGGAPDHAQSGPEAVGDRGGSADDVGRVRAIGVVAVQVLGQQAPFEHGVVLPHLHPMRHVLGRGELHGLRATLLVEQALSADSDEVRARAQRDPARVQAADGDVRPRDRVGPFAVGRRQLVSAGAVVENQRPACVLAFGVAAPGHLQRAVRHVEEVLELDVAPLEVDAGAAGRGDHVGVDRGHCLEARARLDVDLLPAPVEVRQHQVGAACATSSGTRRT